MGDVTLFISCISCGKTHQVFTFEEFYVPCSCGQILRRDRPTAQDIKAETVIWSKEWPRALGLYWLWGRRFSNPHKKLSEMFLVKVVHMGDGKIPAYICDGAFISKEEGAEGYWTPAFPPLPPNEG